MTGPPHRHPPTPRETPSTQPPTRAVGAGHVEEAHGHAHRVRVARLAHFSVQPKRGVLSGEAQVERDARSGRVRERAVEKEPVGREARRALEVQRIVGALFDPEVYDGARRGAALGGRCRAQVRVVGRSVRRAGARRRLGCHEGGEAGSERGREASTFVRVNAGWRAEERCVLLRLGTMAAARKFSVRCAMWQRTGP